MTRTEILFENFVSYDLAWKLRSLKFDDLCVAFLKMGEERPSFVDDPEEYKVNGTRTVRNGEISDEYCAVPTYEQAFSWIEREHNIYSWIEIGSEYIRIPVYFKNTKVMLNPASTTDIAKAMLLDTLIDKIVFTESLKSVNPPKTKQ
jgi:hypothetical protein